MADNTELNAGSGGDTIASDDIAGIKHQRVKMQYGVNGSATDVSDSNPLPIDDAGGSLTVDNAGTFATQATLQSNSGVDIGDVDVLSVIPGTSATNLGKAIDSVVGATDTGVGLLGKHVEDQVHLATADGDYDILSVDSLGSLHVNSEAHHVFDTFNATTGWSALGNDTTNLATTKKHLMGTDALTFDKADGAANTIFAGIQKTLSSVDLGSVSPHDVIQGGFYIPDLTDVSYVFLRLGTDSTNYNEWRLDADLLTAAVFEVGALTIGDADHGGITGNGWDPSAITYICVGVAFNAESNTLAGIIFDETSYHTNQHGSVSINSEVTSSISSANVNINKVGNKVVNTEAGNSGTGTQRVILASDQNFVKLEDAASADADAGIPAMARRTATPADTSGTDLDYEMLQMDNGRLWASTLVTGDALTALQLIDDIVVTDDSPYTLGTDKGAMMMGYAGAQSVDSGDSAALSCNTSGVLHVNLNSQTADITIADGGNTITVDGTVTANLSATDNAVLDQIEVNTSYGDNTGGGTEAGSLRVTIANDSTGLVSIDDGGGSITIDGTVTANLGATDNAVLDDIAAKLAPHATNGHSFYLNQDTSAVASVKASAGTIYWIQCSSIDATPVYLNLYDVASGSVTLGTTTPSMQFIIPSQGDANGSGGFFNFGPLGIQFGTAITVACATTTGGSTDPGTNVVITNIGYE